MSTNAHKPWSKALFDNFMGSAPRWYKIGLLVLLVLNPLIFLMVGPYICGWLILIEFIATLTLALKCYPLLPGGLLAMEATFMGLVSPETILKEASHNFEVILLLMFMVAGIAFMKEFLAWVFTKILFSTRSKINLSLMFCFAGAFLSAWLDALTVTAVMMAVALAFYEIYNSVSYEERVPGDYTESERRDLGRKDLAEFDGFLRNLLMHGAVGTALGGVSTIVGEPQNLIIGNLMGWSFIDFYLMMAHVSLPVLIAGLLTAIVVEKFRIFGYGYQLPERVRNVLKQHTEREKANMTRSDYLKLWAQGLAAIWLILGLALHLAAVGLIGLSVVILLANFTGKDEEHQIGHAFLEAMPFTALLIVFFAIVGLIQSTELFKPIIAAALNTNGDQQLYAFFAASGALSAISDNVFVATIYIQEAVKAFQSGLIDRHQLDLLAIAINVGTNIPSVATPNGQAAFLFLLTSGIASRIKLSYLTMLKLSIPYTIVLTTVALIFLNINWLPHGEPHHRDLNPASSNSQSGH